MGENCAFFGVGGDYHNSGFWEDEDCNAAGYLAICEQYVLANDGGSAGTTAAPAGTGTTATPGTGTTTGGGTTAATAGP